MNQNINLLPNEELEDLDYKNLKIIQSKNEYTFTSDSVLLANFVNIKPKEKTIELCSGSGVIGILACAKNNVQDFSMIEIQPNMANMSKRSIELNNLNIQVYNDDIKNVKNLFEQHSFSYCLANPPYKKVDSHFLGDKNNINCSKFEVFLTLEDLISSTSYLLKHGGKFAIIYDSDRFIELVNMLTKYNLEPKKVQFVYPKSSQNSNVCLIEAVKYGKTGVKILPSIILNDNNNFEPKTMDGKTFIKNG